MMKDVVENAIWSKTKALIQDKYGKTIEFKSINLSQSNSPYFIEGDHLIIPLNSKINQLGEVIVNRGSLLSHEQRAEVCDLIQFLVEPHVYNKYLARQQELQFIEDSTSETTQSKLFSQNVFQLFSSQQDESILKLISNVIHLKSESSLLIQKVAQKLHEMTNNQIMVRWADVSQQFHAVDEIKQFEQTTFFIENLASLTPAELNFLSAAVELNLENVVFIFSSQLTEEEILQLSASTRLKNDLNAICYEIDRVPAHQQLHTDVLELMFFNTSSFNNFM